MHYVFELMDSLTGGAFKRGWREPTAKERVTEWDSLQPDQISQLRERKGDEWFYKEGAAIEKLRTQVNLGVGDARPI